MVDTTKQPDPNAKTEGRKRQEMEAKIKKRDEERAQAEVIEAERKARVAGGTGMISEQPPKAERKMEPADPQRFADAEFKRNQHVLDASEGTQVSDLTEPGYWAHLGERLRPWAEIMVRANDGLWYARVIVLEAGRNWAKVHVEHVEYLTTAEVAITQADAMSPYEIKYRGPHNQWSVIRKADQAVVHEGSGTIDGAVTWLKGRLQADR